MFYTLTHTVNGNVFKLSERREYTMGRRDKKEECDFLLENDASVSRKHIILRVHANHVTFRDNESRYHTLLNGERIASSVDITLNHNDTIQLGMYNHKYRFQCSNLIFEVAASGLNPLKKATLKTHLEKVKGTYTEKWTDSCTHLAVDRLTLTIKVLQALIDEKPIVTLDYFAACAESVEKKLPLPEINMYNKPPVAEQLLRSDFQYKFDPQRKSLFKNKMFVFQTSRCKKQMEDVIQKCGGNCMSWEETPKTYDEISNSPLEYLLVKSAEDRDNASYDAIIKLLLQKDNVRHLAMSEIALAIVYCSCDVHCNRKFDKLAEVFNVSTPQPAAKAILVTETQTQPNVPVKTEKVIPATAEDDWITASSGGTDDNQIAGPSGVKRPSKNTVESETKKLKLEGTKLESDKQSELRLFIGTQKPKIIVLDDSLSENSTCQSQKRKATDQPESNKTNPFGSLASIKKTKTSTAEEEENPFQIFTRPSKTTGTVKLNPFSSLRSASTKTQQIKTETIQPKREPRREIKLIKMRSDVSNISPTKRSFLNVSWISKSSIKEEPIEIAEEKDPEMAIVIEAFKDCVQVKPMKVYVKPEINVVEYVDGKKNFKKFKKVKVLHPQVRIISRNEMVRCVVGDISNDLEYDNFNNDSDDEIPRGSKDKKARASETVNPKKLIKREPVIKKFTL